MFSGTVIKGKQLARELGFPTANVNLPNCTFKTGIYTGTINELECIIYISENLIECHIPNWSGDLYGKNVGVCIGIFLRDHINFNCLDEIITQIKIDILIYNLIHSVKETKGRSFVSFSGGKESCILIDLLSRCNIPFDVIHFKPKDQELNPFMEIFLKCYNKQLIVNEYISFKDSVKEYDNYDNCFIGVRNDDCSIKESSWLKYCKVIYPLFDFSYSDVWKYIAYFNIEVSEKYAEGYTSVGYNCKPNKFLKKFDGSGYIHAKYLNNIELERKKS